VAHRRRSILIGALIAAALVAAIVFGVYGLLRGPAPENPGHSRSSTPPREAPHLPTGLRLVADPVTSARVFARFLYGWDTRDTSRAALLAALENVAVEGPDANGYDDDLTNYLPDDAAWQQVVTVHARQTLTITGARVPASWPKIVHDNHLAAGTIAVTITGTRHRTGTWYGKPVSSSHPVAFTLFLSCPPAQKVCGVLRLSTEGQTLD
jgi:hypothetical protein